MAAGAWGLAQQEAATGWLDRQFPVERVAVSGDRAHVAPREVADAVRSRMEGGFFTVDLEALRAAVERHPWVRRARLARQWPDRLEVRLTEHRPLARWQGEAGEHLVSRRGVVFKRATPQGQGGLPRLVGPRPRVPDLLNRLDRLQDRLGPGHPVTRLAVDARGAWTAEVDGRVTIRFGRKHWQGRLARLLRVDRGWGLLDRAVSRVDLRYPDGLAVAVANADGKSTHPEPAGGSPGSAARL
jgi:cell division protein FtsQ